MTWVFLPTLLPTSCLLKSTRNLQTCSKKMLKKVSFLRFCSVFRNTSETVFRFCVKKQYWNVVHFQKELVHFYRFLIVKLKFLIQYNILNLYSVHTEFPTKIWTWQLLFYLTIFSNILLAFTLQLKYFTIFNIKIMKYFFKYLNKIIICVLIFRIEQKLKHISTTT